MAILFCSLEIEALLPVASDKNIKPGNVRQCRTNRARISESTALSPISATALRKSQIEEALDRLRNIAEHFPLPWSHYTRLLRLRSAYAVEFYHTEAVWGRWTVKQLERPRI